MTVPMERKSQGSITSLLHCLSKGLPAGPSLQQRVALVSVLDSFFTVDALVEGLIREQGALQVHIGCTWPMHPVTISVLAPWWPKLLFHAGCPCLLPY